MARCSDRQLITDLRRSVQIKLETSPGDRVPAVGRQKRDQRKKLAFAKEPRKCVHKRVHRPNGDSSVSENLSLSN
jgi:hypothetical protein